MSDHHTKKMSLGQSFDGMYSVWKERGETLAVLLERFRMIHCLDATTKLTYAGRLDPMAEGIVLILVGEARFQKDILLGLPKTYRVQVLFGIGTDSQDVLGRIVKTDLIDIIPEHIESVVLNLKDLSSLPYPLYSSVLVEGKPLFMHARLGTPVTAPFKKITIHNAQVLSVQTQSLASLTRQALEDIKIVQGDFRQQDILQDWETLMLKNHSVQVTVATIVVSASSGTYMRALASWVGEQLGVPALAYTIIRTSVGPYSL